MTTNDSGPREGGGDDAAPRVYAVVMAGGQGTRFWPLSRAARPKQLLPLGGGDESLLRATVRRIAELVPPERVLVVTGANLKDGVLAELPELPPENVLAEPLGRNTAPCVGWAAATVARRDPASILAVLAADHFIGDEPAYVEVLRRAVRTAATGELVTVGIQPTRPETGYGYLELGDALGDGVFRARRFVEKPDRARAEEFLRAGNFLWNSGMFFFRADVVLAAIERFLPQLARGLTAFDAAAAKGEEAEAVARGYAELPGVSIDTGVMERAERVAVVPGDFGWSDVGSWTTAWELAEKDGEGNALPADAVSVDGARNYVRAPHGKVVALVGVADLVVVDTEDALLVMPRERAQDVRAVVDALRARGSLDRL
jgi:mannose-1-phosphate guanylyltransferase